MNNQQFRRLVLDTPARQPGAENGQVAATPRRDGASPAALGSRMRASIPMTPRSVMGSGAVDFKRQLAERDRENQPQKRFRSAAAPKGSRLAAGYTDRTLQRTSAEEDDKAARVQALEEQMKLGQIDEATFRQLRDQIVGGDISSTHLVKGLDFKLLERVRRGEDVLNATAKGDEAPSQEEEKVEDVDEEFEKLEQKEIAPVAKEKTVKKGEMAPPPAPGTVAGRKRTRDEILAELKASRQAAKAAAQPSLGSKFKKIGERPTESKSRIEIDEKGREVLITVDEDGKVKRKVRKAPPEEKPAGGKNGLLLPEKDAKPLGMEVPVAPAPPPAEEDDGDIFEGVGLDYDPLGGLGDDGDEDTSEEEGEAAQPPMPSKAQVASEERETGPSPPPDQTPKLPRNYFGGTSSSSTADIPPTSEAPSNPLTDPAILAALKKASSIAPISSASSDETSEEKARLEERRRKLLEAAARDDIDIDMGFGSSRLEDEEDFEDKKVKLSVWGRDEAGEGGKKDKGGQPRKRGPKKRKGDKNSAADVLRVMESRKKT